MNYEYLRDFKIELKKKDIRHLIAVKVFFERILQDINAIKDVDALKERKEMIIILQQQWTIIKWELSCR